MSNLKTNNTESNVSTVNNKKTDNNYKETKGDPLWIDDRSILFQKSKLTEFIPNNYDYE